MASGTIPKYITPFKAGDSFTVATGAGSYTGFVFGNSVYSCRCLIPLTKPVEPGLVATITGSIRVRAIDSGGTITSTTISGLNVTATPNDTGLAVDFTATTALGLANAPCSVGSSGITITFVASS